MIVKMKFINISGPRNDIDRVTDTYQSIISDHLLNSIHIGMLSVWLINL